MTAVYWRAKMSHINNDNDMKINNVTTEISFEISKTDACVQFVENYCRESRVEIVG